MGLALDIHNEFRLTLHRPFAIDVSGESAEQLPRTRKNVVVQAMQKVFDEIGFKDSNIPEFALQLENQIPVSSGLGSSASAIVGGLVLGNELVRILSPRSALSRDMLLKLATRMEGHPDNVAPALMGGGVLAFHDKAGLRTVPFPIPNELRFVAATPDFALSTEHARQVLPVVYPRQEVIENVAQSARLMLALTSGNLNLLQGGITDYLHEPYRKALVPGADEVAGAALSAGALCVTLSGAGPTLLAWCKAEVAAKIADEMTLAWRSLGTSCRALVLPVKNSVTEAVVIRESE